MCLHSCPSDTQFLSCSQPLQVCSGISAGPAELNESNGDMRNEKYYMRGMSNVSWLSINPKSDTPQCDKYGMSSLLHLTSDCELLGADVLDVPQPTLSWDANCPGKLRLEREMQPANAYDVVLSSA